MKRPSNTSTTKDLQVCLGVRSVIGNQFLLRTCLQFTTNFQEVLFVKDLSGGISLQNGAVDNNIAVKHEVAFNVTTTIKSERSVVITLNFPKTSTTILCKGWFISIFKVNSTSNVQSAICINSTSNSSCTSNTQGASNQSITSCSSNVELISIDI